MNDRPSIRTSFRTSVRTQDDLSKYTSFISKKAVLDILFMSPQSNIAARSVNIHNASLIKIYTMCSYSSEEICESVAFTITTTETQTETKQVEKVYTEEKEETYIKLLEYVKYFHCYNSQYENVSDEEKAMKEIPIAKKDMKAIIKMSGKDWVDSIGYMQIQITAISYEEIRRQSMKTKKYNRKYDFIFKIIKTFEFNMRKKNDDGSDNKIDVSSYSMKRLIKLMNVDLGYFIPLLRLMIVKEVSNTGDKLRKQRSLLYNKAHILEMKKNIEDDENDTIIHIKQNNDNSRRMNAINFDVIDGYRESASVLLHELIKKVNDKKEEIHSVSNDEKNICVKVKDINDHITFVNSKLYEFIVNDTENKYDQYEVKDVKGNTKLLSKKQLIEENDNAMNYLMMDDGKYANKDDVDNLYDNFTFVNQDGLLNIEDENDNVIQRDVRLIDLAVKEMDSKDIEFINPEEIEEQKEKERLAKEEAERLAKEEAERLEKERLAKEEAERIEKERLAKEEAERLEKERLAKEEAERLEKERLAKEEAERLEKERLAKEEAERLAKEEEERLAKEEAERLAKEEAERLAKEEAERLAREEAERIERERLAKEEAERLEKERLAKEEAERLEKERLAKEEAERLAKEESERLEKERLAKEEAERLEKERLAKEEAERLAKEEAERLAKEEEERLAREEKERQEKEAFDKLNELKSSSLNIINLNEENNNLIKVSSYSSKTPIYVPISTMNQLSSRTKDDSPSYIKPIVYSFPSSNESPSQLTRDDILSSLGDQDNRYLQINDAIIKKSDLIKGINEITVNDPFIKVHSDNTNEELSLNPKELKVATFKEIQLPKQIIDTNNELKESLKGINNSYKYIKIGKELLKFTIAELVSKSPSQYDTYYFNQVEGVNRVKYSKRQIQNILPSAVHYIKVSEKSNEQQLHFLPLDDVNKSINDNSSNILKSKDNNDNEISLEKDTIELKLLPFEDNLEADETVVQKQPEQKKIDLIQYSKVKYVKVPLNNKSVYLREDLLQSIVDHKQSVPFKNYYLNNPEVVITKQIASQSLSSPERFMCVYDNDNKQKDEIEYHYLNSKVFNEFHGDFKDSLPVDDKETSIPLSSLFQKESTPLDPLPPQPEEEKMKVMINTMNALERDIEKNNEYVAINDKKDNIVFIPLHSIIEINSNTDKSKKYKVKDSNKNELTVESSQVADGEKAQKYIKIKDTNNNIEYIVNETDLKNEIKKITSNNEVTNSKLILRDAITYNNISVNPLLLSIVKLGEEDYEVKQEEEEIDLHESELKGGNNRLRAVPKQKRIFKVRRVVVCKVKK